MNKPEKFVYLFSEDKTDGDASLRNALGGKGANLAEMSKLQVPVPPGFTISTDICAFYNKDTDLPDWVKAEVKNALAEVEKRVNKKFGDAENPLLVSVRSGARVSMPGMMDTILNLGLNDTTVQGLATKSGSERFAWDSYRRFIQMYSDVVMGMNHSLLDVALEDLKADRGLENDSDLSVEDLKGLVKLFKNQVLDRDVKCLKQAVVHTNTRSNTPGPAPTTTTLSPALPHPRSHVSSLLPAAGRRASRSPTNSPPRPK